jgi:hypothetical protein
MSKLPDLLDSFLTFLVGLSPGALGAAVSLAHEKGLTWSERCIQFAAGTTVSFFTARGIDAVTSLDPFVLQGIGFSAGMVAFKSTPRFIASAADVIGGLPALIVGRFFPARKDKP